ncbi:hypothetical protein BC567DRAFT_94642 [Phyllosticta citribraziliensis]
MIWIEGWDGPRLFQPAQGHTLHFAYHDETFVFCRRRRNRYITTNVGIVKSSLLLHPCPRRTVFERVPGSTRLIISYCQRVRGNRGGRLPRFFNHFLVRRSFWLFFFFFSFFAAVSFFLEHKFGSGVAGEGRDGQRQSIAPISSNGMHLGSAEVDCVWFWCLYGYRLLRIMYPGSAGCGGDERGESGERGGLYRMVG